MIQFLILGRFGMTAHLPELATALSPAQCSETAQLRGDSGTAAPGDAGASHQAAGRRRPEREG